MQKFKLEISHLDVFYNSKIVLKDLSACFYSGEIHGILGTNGAGKTTFFKTIYGMLKANSGSIKTTGLDYNTNNIAFLETEPAFYPYMKGREYISLLSHNNSSFNTDTWNELFNLPLNSFIETYSTGMKKKLSLLGVLALDRPIMLLDEPYSALDLETVNILDTIIKELKDQGKVILLTSHILDVLRKNCTKISFLHDGVIQKIYERKDFDILEETVDTFITQKTESTIEYLFR